MLRILLIISLICLVMISLHHFLYFRYMLVSIRHGVWYNSCPTPAGSDGYWNSGPISALWRWESLCIFISHWSNSQNVSRYDGVMIAVYIPTRIIMSLFATNHNYSMFLKINDDWYVHSLIAIFGILLLWADTVISWDSHIKKLWCHCAACFESFSILFFLLINLVDTVLPFLINSFGLPL